ncbi:MAG: hypothetical protein ABEJ91_00735 [Candidatus Nanohaloarchaea archaeon]
MIENEVRAGYIREILGALGAKDFSNYAEDEEVGILASKNHMEEIVAAHRGEDDVNLGNEILYLRDRGLLEAEPGEEDIWVGIRHARLGRPEKLIWDSETSIDYPLEEPGWTDGPEDGPGLEGLNLEDVLEVEYVIADAVKKGSSRVTAEHIQRFIDGGRTPWPELSVLASTGRGEIDMEDGTLSYIPNPEYLDEFYSLASYRVRKGTGPVHEFHRNMGYQDFRKMQEEGVDIVDELLSSNTS